MRKTMRLWLAAIAALTLAPQAWAQYDIGTLFLDGAPIPGSTNTWSVNAGAIPSLPLSIDGNYVAFVQCSQGCGPLQTTDGIWVENLSTSSFTHLVAPGDAAPGTGGATFGSFGGYALVAGGHVFFLSLDATTNGLYSVPVTGGAVTAIANLNTDLPGLGHASSFTLGNSEQYLPQADAVQITFFAKNATGEAWSYIANLDGTGLTELAGVNTQIMLPGSCQVPVDQFLQPRVYGSNVALMGSTDNGIGPFLYRLGLTGFPTAPTCSPGGFVVDAPILQYNTPLPGEPAGTQFFYASYLTLDNSQVYFTAANSSPGSYGVFREALDGSGLTAILNSDQPVFGLDPPFVMSGGTTGFAAENGTLVFSLGGTAAGGSAGALLAYQNGGLVRIAGTGDVLAGATGNFWAPPIGPNSIDAGRVVFSFGNPERIGFFLASPAPAASPLVAAVLPSSRSVELGTTASAFATMINSGSASVTGCAPTLATSIPAAFSYQTTDPASNALTGSPNTPATIASGKAQSFVIALTPSAAFAATDTAFTFACSSVTAAPILSGVDTLLLSGSATPVPDIVALAASADPGIVDIPGATGAGAFAVATVNVGAGAPITVTADTGSASLPLTLALCQTDPVSGQCISPVGPSVTATIGSDATPTFAIFVQGSGTVPFSPGSSRIFVRFADAGGAIRGSTSVAVRTE